jgi:UDP-N-acetylmuramoyl-L-alanyl-D-glutamate--2,6-diaminopimelate ligase
MVVDRAEAIAQAIAAAHAGDCVVIAGKGHEDYQIIDGERRYFSDEQQALAAIARRSAT